MKKLGCLFLLILCYGCNVDKFKKVDPGALDFTTTDQSELFFRNVRQSSYHIEENAEAGLFLYRHKKWDTGQAFTPMIVFNWRNDRAYVMIEPEAAHDSIGLIIGSKDGRRLQLTYVQGDMKEQLLFLTAVYNGIAESSEILVASAGGEHPVFSSRAQMDIFRIIMYDYYRLTGIF